MSRKKEDISTREKSRSREEQRTKGRIIFNLRLHEQLFLLLFFGVRFDRLERGRDIMFILTPMRDHIIMFLNESNESKEKMRSAQGLYANMKITHLMLFTRSISRFDHFKVTHLSIDWKSNRLLLLKHGVFPFRKARFLILVRWSSVRSTHCCQGISDQGSSTPRSSTGRDRTRRFLFRNDYFRNLNFNLWLLLRNSCAIIVRLVSTK